MVSKSIRTIICILLLTIVVLSSSGCTTIKKWWNKNDREENKKVEHELQCLACDALSCDACKKNTQCVDGICGCKQCAETVDPNATTQANPKYLLFQLSNANPEIPVRNPAGISTKAQIEKAVDEIVAAIGERGDHVNQQLGFTTGPLMFDLTDEQMRILIADSFAVAEEKNVAVAFHIDDSMFWNARKDLWSNKNNVEWSDWQGTIVPHRIIGWVADGKPVLAPPMCYNSPAIKTEAARIARDVIGPAIKRGLDHLNTIGKPYLFAGVMAGWETRIQDEMANGSHVYYAYCALHNLGYSTQNLPADISAARGRIVTDWVTLWTKNLVAAGIPKTRVYTHIAFPGDASPSEPFTPAFNEYSYPGFSIYGAGTYPVFYKKLAARAATPWGISEGANVNLANSFSGGTSASGYTMEQYLGGAFNHGAVYINVFGWGDQSAEGYSQGTQSTEAITAYQKFLRGESLGEGSGTTVPPINSDNDLFSKVQKIQVNLPDWLSQHPDQQPNIQPLMQKLDEYMKTGNATEAEKTADEILNIIAQ